jgi:hypothetical protein
MSATVTCVATDQFMGVFYAGKKGGAFDFGADYSRTFIVKEMCEAHWDDAGAFFGDDGAYCYMSGQEFWSRVEPREWTFGVFGGTFEVGSGHMVDWMGI